MEITTAIEGPALPVRSATGRSFLHRLAHIANGSRLGTAAAVILLGLVLVAIFAKQLAPYKPLVADYAHARTAPSSRHLLGSDDLGRDVLSRLLYGARVSLLVAVASVALGDSLGFVWGTASAYLGGKVDLLSQRLLDILLSFPSLLLALLLTVSLGAGLRTVILAIAVSRVPMATRVVRSMVLSVKEFTYVEAARATGASQSRIMARHIAPQCVAPFLIVASTHLGVAVFTEAALSFLGVGIAPPTPSWGNMLGGVLAQAFNPPWWMALFPGIAITLTILAANLLGDAMRDFLDPTLRDRVS